MRKFLLLLVAALGLAVLPATAASAGSTLVYYEKVGADDVVFVPACTPGPQNPTCDPRGPGSWFSSVGDLSRTQGGTKIGTVTVFCLTTRKVGADYYGHCTEVLYTPEGIFEARGEINETGLERFEPQRLALVKPGPGTLTVQQIVFPDEFRLTVTR